MELMPVRMEIVDGIKVPIVQAAPVDIAAVRVERTRRLAASDWIVMRSVERGEQVPEAWLAYRQALRDITEQPDPGNIVWPQQPSHED